MEYIYITDEEKVDAVMEEGLQYFYDHGKVWKPVPQKFLGKAFDMYDMYVEYRMPITEAKEACTTVEEVKEFFDL